jgi:serine O-acetyltransferase
VIGSRSELKQYLHADWIALSSPRGVRAWLFEDIWRYQRCLRRLEYRLNTGANPFLLAVAKFRLRRLGRLLGFLIPPNVFGPGLSIAHPGTIIVNSTARIGANCRIHVDVVIGGETVIGDNCYLGPGAKLFDSIEIGPNTSIGANAVVTRSFPHGNATLVGVPATKTDKDG